MPTGKAKLTEIIVGPADGSLGIGDTLAYRCLAIDSTGSSQDVTQLATWTSSNPAVATVDATGLVTAVAAGSAAIQAAYSGLTDSKIAQVEVTLSGITIYPAGPVWTAGQALQNALGQLALFMGGQATVAVETPQLGRVEFNKTNIGDLQRLIQQLTDACAAAGGPLPAGCSGLRRRPISVQVWP